MHMASVADGVQKVQQFLLSGLDLKPAAVDT